jgi:tRNA(Ile)-lysidine synthase
MHSMATPDPIPALTAAIEAALADLPLAPVWIGFSGGVDSSTLLACAAASPQLRARGLHALHVHHGLHADADRWADHAVALASREKVPCAVVRVDVSARGRGIEAAARDARHAAFAAALTPGAALLLAHHREDQAETLLLRMLRGASVDGLGAMRPRRILGAGWLLRPWLALPRAAIVAAARDLGIDWIEDPANFDLQHDRSYLRQQVWPLLAGRFPALGERLARLAEHAASVSDELEQAAARVLDQLIGNDPNTLAIPGLLTLGDALFGAVVRRFARELGVAPPGFHELARLRREVLLAAVDGNPRLRWDGHEFRRYREKLYLLPQATTLPAPAAFLQWPVGSSELELPGGLGRLCAVGGDGRPARVPTALGVCWRRGGERLRPTGSTHTRELRLIFQELGVPPWQRERVPLLFDGKQLVAAVGIVVGDRLGQLWPQIRVEWKSPRG